MPIFASDRHLHREKKQWNDRDSTHKCNRMLKSILKRFAQIIFILSGHRYKHALSDPEGFTLRGCEEPAASPYPGSRAQHWDEGPTRPVPH